MLRFVTTPGLKTAVENDIFWSEMWSGFGEEGGTPPSRILWRTPQAVILVYGVVNVTKSLARLDAHTYVYKGRRFHAPQFLNCCYYI